MTLARPDGDRRYAQDSSALLLPFMQSADMVHMGLQRLDDSQWIQPCQNLPHYFHNRLRARRCLGDRVFAQLPRSMAAQRELHQLLLQLLCRHQRRAYSIEGGLLRWRGEGASLCWPLADGGEPLWTASQWVADDLCLLQPGARGYELTAASLAAPSYWRLEEKIGRPLDSIHAPVPGFRDKLSAQVTRFFDHLLPDYPVWRSNWTVVNSAELTQRGDSKVEDEKLFLRVERQSLRRLPESGAVVFTIRVMINPLTDLLPVAGAVTSLRRAVERLSPEESKYKSLAPLLPSLNAFLASPAGERAENPTD
ncbi:heme-dependent oxidative N-demethylase family protein [Microbulbifer taiwanensis]|uniref:DUF3445 domain-containing protein n=1 Tax=Microbulbifer taiwanensis TaxID=986746 RepID=A0ABW1YRK9_9GAMM|nr:DUF3445 domain-containing protein [Microbulbifer taiwanensis]